MLCPSVTLNSRLYRHAQNHLLKTTRLNGALQAQCAGTARNFQDDIIKQPRA
jgi:hypothetical protein